MNSVAFIDHKVIGISTEGDLLGIALVGVIGTSHSTQAILLLSSKTVLALSTRINEDSDSDEITDGKL